MRHRRLAGLSLALALALGCRSNPSSDDDANDSTSEGGETSPDACSADQPCETGFCVATWDASASQRGVAQCVAECVAELELDRFCIDDASCCEGLECAIDGLCEPPWQPSTETDSSGSDSSESETDSSGSDSSESETDSSDSGTTSDSGTGSDSSGSDSSGSDSTG